MQDQQSQSSRNLSQLKNSVTKVIKSSTKNEDKSIKQKLLMELHKLQNQQDSQPQPGLPDTIVCIICSNYLLKPVSCCCGHSFCYSLCPICSHQIRSFPSTSNNSLNQFVEIFIRQNDKEYVPEYQRRIKGYKEYRERRKLTGYFAGMKLDVRDQNYVWSQGIVNRLISRVGQPIKYLRIQFLDQNAQIKTEDIKSNSHMLADFGFFTNRKQLPKYKHTKIVSKS